MYFVEGSYEIINEFIYNLFDLNRLFRNDTVFDTVFRRQRQFHRELRPESRLASHPDLPLMIFDDPPRDR